MGNLGNLFLGTFCLATPWESCLGTCSWEPLGTCFWEPCLGTLAWEHCLGTCWNEPLPVTGNLAWEPFAWETGSVSGNLAWEPLPGNLAWEPLPGNLAWEPLPGGTSSCYLAWNLFLGTLLGNPGNLAWEPSSWEPGPTWEPCAVGFWLLRPAPGPLLWLKTPSLRCWGKR